MPSSRGHRQPARCRAPAAKSSPELSASLPQPTLAPGDSGPRVVQLQQVLTFWHFYLAKCDGLYGPKTTKAVETWQRELRKFGAGAIDGRFGPKTHAAVAASYEALKDMKDAA